MKEEFELQAVKLILSLFDLDLWLQDHSSDLKLSFSSTHYRHCCAKYKNSFSKEKGELALRDVRQILLYDYNSDLEFLFLPKHRRRLLCQIWTPSQKMKEEFAL